MKRSRVIDVLKKPIPNVAVGAKIDPLGVPVFGAVDRVSETALEFAKKAYGLLYSGVSYVTNEAEDGLLMLAGAVSGSTNTKYPKGSFDTPPPNLSPKKMRKRRREEKPLQPEKTEQKPQQAQLTNEPRLETTPERERWFESSLKSVDATLKRIQSNKAKAEFLQQTLLEIAPFGVNNNLQKQLQKRLEQLEPKDIIDGVVDVVGDVFVGAVERPIQVGGGSAELLGLAGAAFQTERAFQSINEAIVEGGRAAIESVEQNKTLSSMRDNKRKSSKLDDALAQSRKKSTVSEEVKDQEKSTDKEQELETQKTESNQERIWVSQEYGGYWRYPNLTKSIQADDNVTQPEVVEETKPEEAKKDESAGEEEQRKIMQQKQQQEQQQELEKQNQEKQQQQQQQQQQEQQRQQQEQQQRQQQQQQQEKERQQQEQQQQEQQQQGQPPIDDWEYIPFNNTIERLKRGSDLDMQEVLLGAALRGGSWLGSSSLGLWAAARSGNPFLGQAVTLASEAVASSILGAPALKTISIQEGERVAATLTASIEANKNPVAAVTQVVRGLQSQSASTGRTPEAVVDIFTTGVTREANSLKPAALAFQHYMKHQLVPYAIP